MAREVLVGQELSKRDQCARYYFSYIIFRSVDVINGWRLSVVVVETIGKVEGLVLVEVTRLAGVSNGAARSRQRLYDAVVVYGGGLMERGVL